MNPIGIMQGRLSLPARGRIQSFPLKTWKAEFALARAAGLDCIEWIFEDGTDQENPLRNDAGTKEILEESERSGVEVRSVCADYYMSRRLVADDGTLCPASIEHLRWLLGRIRGLGAKYVVLPFVDSSSLATLEQRVGFVRMIREVVPESEMTGVELHLETDLPPREFASVLSEISHPLVHANFDIGNSASLAYDPAEELPLIGPWLGSVHVKDRLRGGGTVPLGAGHADFATCFRLIRGAGFFGPFILQAAREDGVSELDLARRNRTFVERYWNGPRA